MKYISKQIEDARTGSMSEHHTVTGLQVDYVNNSTFVTIASYVSKPKRMKEKNPYLSTHLQFKLFQAGIKFRMNGL